MSISGILSQVTGQAAGATQGAPTQGAGGILSSITGGSKPSDGSIGLFDGVMGKAMLGAGVGAAASFILPFGPILGGLLGAAAGAGWGIWSNMRKIKAIQAENAAALQALGIQPQTQEEAQQLLSGQIPDRIAQEIAQGKLPVQQSGAGTGVGAGNGTVQVGQSPDVTVTQTPSQTYYDFIPKIDVTVDQGKGGTSPVETGVTVVTKNPGQTSDLFQFPTVDVVGADGKPDTLPPQVTVVPTVPAQGGAPVQQSPVQSDPKSGPATDPVQADDPKQRWAEPDPKATQTDPKGGVDQSPVQQANAAWEKKHANRRVLREHVHARIDELRRQWRSASPEQRAALKEQFRAELEKLRETIRRAREVWLNDRFGPSDPKTVKGGIPVQQSPVDPVPPTEPPKGGVEPPVSEPPKVEVPPTQDAPPKVDTPPTQDAPPKVDAPPTQDVPKVDAPDTPPKVDVPPVIDPKGGSEPVTTEVPAQVDQAPPKVVQAA